MSPPAGVGRHCQGLENIEMCWVFLLPVLFFVPVLTDNFQRSDTGLIFGFPASSHVCLHSKQQC